MSDEAKKGAQQLPVKVPDDILGGAYSNHMEVSHTREEFFLDFFTLLPQVGKLSGRIIVSPGHVKRIVRALAENLARYEEAYGPVPEIPEPTAAPKIVN